MLTKRVVWFGRECTLACDGRCDKAWGLNNRPMLHYMTDGLRELAPGEQPLNPDDYVFRADDDLGIAPADPGTYEGGYGKPSGVPLTDPLLMNKWCARECERSGVFEDGELVRVPDLSRPRPNIPRG